MIEILENYFQKVKETLFSYNLGCIFYPKFSSCTKREQRSIIEVSIMQWRMNEFLSGGGVLSSYYGLFRMSEPARGVAKTTPFRGVQA